MRIIRVKGQNILLLSDTHGMHRLLDIPEGIDIVIHCGDVCDAGDMQQLSDSLCGMRGFPYYTRYLFTEIMISPLN